MAEWNSDELDKIGSADELEIITIRQDGTPRKPVIIWVVRVGDDLYVRSYRGSAGGWFRGAQAQRLGSIRAGGIEKAVVFVPETGSAVNDRIDDAYRAKYSRSAQYVPPMLTPEVRGTTIRLVPD